MSASGDGVVSFGLTHTWNTDTKMPMYPRLNRLKDLRSTSIDFMKLKSVVYSQKLICEIDQEGKNNDLKSLGYN